MGLYQRILDDLKTAMLAKDSEKVAVLRMMKSKILEKEISMRQGEKVVLDDDIILGILQTAVKQRMDSAKQYRMGNRMDLVAVEEQEIDIIKTYLPQPLSDDELSAIIKEVITETNATSSKDMGRVIGAVMKRVKTRADGNRVRLMVQTHLK